MKILNKVLFFVVLQLVSLSLAQASSPVCVQGQVQITLGKSKPVKAILKLQSYFERVDGIAESFIKEVLNPEGVFYIDNAWPESFVEDIFPKWTRPSLIRLVQSPLSSDFKEEGNVRNFEPRTMGGNGKWILRVTFKDLKFDPRATDDAFLKKIQQMEFIRTINYPEPREWFREKLENLQICNAS